MVLIFSFIFLLSGCGDHSGVLVFETNGENYVRQGFKDKTGWFIQFDHLFVNISQPTAYFGHALKAQLAGDYLVDLTKASAAKPNIEVGRLSTRPGNYQSLKFTIKRIVSGKYAGYSVIMIGHATRAGERVPFKILLDAQIEFDGPDGYVGDRVKGIVKKDQIERVEMTFHFDHIFGDQSASLKNHVNTGAVGFDFFHQFKKAGEVDVRQQDLVGSKGYEDLLRSLDYLGHLGEGHCLAKNL